MTGWIESVTASQEKQQVNRTEPQRSTHQPPTWFHLDTPRWHQPGCLLRGCHPQNLVQLKRSAVSAIVLRSDLTVPGQATDASQQRLQVFAVDEFHGEKKPAFALSNVINATCVGMRHLPRH